MNDTVMICVRTWTSPDECSIILVVLPRPLYDTLAAFVEQGVIPDEPELASVILDGHSPIATREERAAITGRIANERGTPAPVTTWTIVTY